jgi:cytochrome b pre-mRNA-processing protein 3
MNVTNSSPLFSFHCNDFKVVLSLSSYSAMADSINGTNETCEHKLPLIRNNTDNFLQTSVRTTRTFTTTPSFHVVLPEPNATPATSIPPVTPQVGNGGPSKTNTPISHKAAAELRRVAGRTTETYGAYGVAEALFKQCAAQADYSIPQASDSNAEMPKTADGEDLGVGSGWWHTGNSPPSSLSCPHPHPLSPSRTKLTLPELALNPTFSTWSQVTMLHLYILTTRLRMLPPTTRDTYSQHLLDHFFYAAENKMIVSHNMHARGTRNKYLKDLFLQWRGLLAAYDEGLLKGDSVLAAAVWRNVFKAGEEVDLRGVACVVGYLRSELRGVEGLGDGEVMRGEVEFGEPGKEMGLVQQRSKMMDLPFKEGNVINEPVQA